jgi:hypothetical protein
MIRSSKRRFTLLALFALALVTMSPTSSYVHAEDVQVVEDAAAAVVAESLDATEEVLDSTVVETLEEEKVDEPVKEVVDEPVKEVVEDVTLEQDDEEGEEEVKEAAAPVIVESSKDDDEKEGDMVSEVVEQVKDASNQSASVLAEKTSELIAKVKDAIKSADLDAKKVAAFGLGAWGTATGIGWAMEKIGGKKED